MMDLNKMHTDEFLDDMTFLEEMLEDAADDYPRLMSTVGHHTCPHCGQRSYFEDEACCYLCLKYKGGLTTPMEKEVQKYWKSGLWKKAEASFIKKGGLNVSVQ